jgi:uncharacterized protein DUF4373
MARPRKNNADYFSHDANARHDIKIKALESEMGLKGYVLYFKFLEFLAGSDYYEIDISKPYIISSLPLDLGCTKQEFDDFLELAMNFELLNKENDIIYSPGLKKRLAGLDRTRELDRNRKGNNELDQNPQNSFPDGINTENTLNTPSKEKENKEKEKKEKKRIFHQSMSKDELTIALINFDISREIANEIVDQYGMDKSIEELMRFEKHILNQESYSKEEKKIYILNLLKVKK